MARRSGGRGFQDFLEGFNGTYGTAQKVMRDYETQDIMNEKPEASTYTPEQVDEIQKQADAGTLKVKDGGYEGLAAPTSYTYNGKTFDAKPTDMQIDGLRSARLADVAQKYGDHEGAMRMRKYASDSAWDAKSRARQEVDWGRADEENARKDKGREILNTANLQSSEAYAGTQQALSELDDKIKRGELSPQEAAEAQKAKGLYAAHFSKTPAQALREASQQLMPIDPQAAAAAAARAKSMVDEGAVEVLKAYESGKRGKALTDVFNSSGIYRVEGEIKERTVKGANGKPDVELSGVIDGKERRIMLSDIRRSTMDEYKAQHLEIERDKAASSRATADAAVEANKLAREARAEEKKAAAARQVREDTNKAGEKLQEWAGRSPLVYEYDPDTKKTRKNEQTASEFQDFLVAHGNAIPVGDGKAVSLSQLGVVDPERAQNHVNQLGAKFALHKELEKAAGKKMPVPTHYEVGAIKGSDWGIGVNKGLGFNDAMKAINPANDNRVIRMYSGEGENRKELGVIRYSDAVSGKYGEMFKQMLPPQVKDAAPSAKKEAATPAAPSAKPSERGFVSQQAISNWLDKPTAPAVVTSAVEGLRSSARPVNITPKLDVSALRQQATSALARGDRNEWQRLNNTANHIARNQ